MGDSYIEILASKVHDAWWKEKKSQGFHPPSECIDWSFGCDQFEKICDFCHGDMYPYGELSDHVQEYDRVTVRTVLSAIAEADKTLEEVER